MKWSGRSVFLLVIFSVVASSLFTMSIFQAGFPSSLTSQDAFSPNGGLLSSGKEFPKEFDKLYDAYEIIRKEYVDDIPSEKLIEGAIEGMIDSLKDPYSDYMDPESAKEFNSSLHSTFEGIGAEVTMQDGRVTIVSPFKGSPAEAAGLRPNDQIISVNGESLEGLDLQQAVLKIRGPKGTKATLKVLRPGVSEALTIVVVRDTIPIETVSSEVAKQGGKTFGYIQITQFAESTYEDFKKALEDLEAQQIQGLIIDVRGNPGGYLDAVTKIGKLLIPKDEVMVKIQYGGTEKGTTEFRSEGTAKKPYPIVVLIDNGSASASEILAAALRDTNGSILVGEKTFGKGTVQSTKKLADDSQLKLTIAKWLTPKGEWIHGKGISPDVQVSQPDFFFAQLPSEKELAPDMNGQEVKNLQIILKGLGYPATRQDGYFDNSTLAAVKKFQTDHALPVTGKVDKATAIKLQETLLKAFRDKKYDRQFQKALEVLEGQVK